MQKVVNVHEATVGMVNIKVAEHLEASSGFKDGRIYLLVENEKVARVNSTVHEMAYVMVVHDIVDVLLLEKHGSVMYAVVLEIVQLGAIDAVYGMPIPSES